MPGISLGEKSDWAAEGRDIPIPLGDVADLLEPWRDGRPVTSAVFLAGGLMNRNYRVRVGDDDVVLRFCDRDPRACRKEAALLRELHGRVFVPRLFYESEDTKPTPFIVTEFVDGISLRELKKAGDVTALSEAAHAAGRELAKLAFVRLRDPAIVAPDFSSTPELLDGENVNARLIERFLESALLRERLGEARVARVREFAWRHQVALAATETNTGIAHGDFNSANILVRHDGLRWSVAAILDWEFAFNGSTLHDVGNFLRYEHASKPRFEPSFSRGLIDGGFSLSNGWRTTARAADLSALCELLTRPATPPAVAEEVRDLVLATLD